MVKFPDGPPTTIKYPTGFAYSGDRTKIAVAFPSELFKDIIAMAKAEKKEFNAMVVELVKVGKLDLDESDALEEKKHEHPVQRHQSK